MADPSWYETWIAAWEDFSAAYQAMAPRQWPKNLFSETGEGYKDQQGVGEILSWLRKGSKWISECFWPWLDAAYADAASTAAPLFLERWEEVFGLAPRGTTYAERANRVLASFRNRGTMTEDRLKAIFISVFGTTDPDKLSLVAPTPENTWGANIAWHRLNWPHDVTQNLKACSGNSYIHSTLGWQGKTFAVGDTGKIYLWSSISGDLWTEHVSGTANNLCDVWSMPTNELFDFSWAVGDSGTIREYTSLAWGAGPGGGPADNLKGVWGHGRYYDTTLSKWRPEYTWVCGDGDRVSRYDWRNASWTTWQPNSGGADQWNDIHALAHNDAIAVSDQGNVGEWDGTSWTITNITAQELYGVRKFGVNEIWACGANGEVWKRGAGGWATESIGGGTDKLFHIDGYDIDHLVIVGENGVSFRYDADLTPPWRAVNTNCHGEDLYGVFIDIASCYVWAVGDNGWTLNTPVTGDGYVENQNQLHIYSTSLDLDPYPDTRTDKLRLCRPAWHRWTAGRRKTLRASDSGGQSGASNSCAE
jgi:hypothetical protein